MPAKSKTKCKPYSRFYEDFADLYGPSFKVYGPYRRKDGRKIVILYDGVKRSGRQYARIKLEIKLGRFLGPDEEVDHKDGNFRNDKFRNLQLLSSTKNRKKQQVQLYGKPVKLYCAYCSTFVLKVYSKKRVRTRFCSHSCSQRYFKANQYGNALTGYSK